MEDINTTLDAHGKIDKVVVLQEEWTLENNLLTPSFKIKRNEIEKRYTAFYQQWYDNKNRIVRQ